MFTRHFQLPPIIFAPMPKTASNTLLRRLEACIDCLLITPKSGGGIGHFALDSRQLLRSNKSILHKKTPIIYQHFLPTENNRKHLCAQLNTQAAPKVIVSIRNIYDVAISCADHQRKDKGPWWITREETSALNTELADEHSHLWNAIICLKFYAAWSIAAQSEKWDIKFIQYDNITQHPGECLKDIANFFEKKISYKSLTDIANIKGNLNIGQPNRGENLDPFFKEALQRLALSFKNIDFSLIGLDSNT